MSEYILPTSTTRVTDDFADHVARGSVNPGTDYACPYGSVVRAVKGGTVIAADSTTTGSGGRLIYIDHGDGTRADYIHLSRIDVFRGQHVDQGQQIGLSGASAWGSDWGVGPHLHIALHVHGRNVDFETYVSRTNVAGSGAKPITVRDEDEDMKLYHVKGGTIALIGPYTNHRYTSMSGGQAYSIEANKRAYGMLTKGMTEDVVATLGAEADARRAALVNEIAAKLAK